MFVVLLCLEMCALEKGLCVCVCVCVCVHVRAQSSLHEIFQARILEWVTISFSRASSQHRDQNEVSCISCIGRQLLHHCATWGVLKDIQIMNLKR